jgi:Protein of unknown function, DUF547
VPMRRDDPRLEYMPILFDERMHFALHSACRSSPPLRVFDGGRLDQQFEEAAAEHVRRTVRIERDGAVMVLPRLFRWFAEDFGGEGGIVDFVVARIDDEKAVGDGRPPPRRGEAAIRRIRLDAQPAMRIIAP